MRIIVNTNNAKDLRRRIFQKVERNEMQTWEKRTIKGKEYLTHSAEQYIDKAYIELSTKQENILIIKICKENEDIDVRIVNIYYGKFISAVLNSFPELNESVLII